MKKNRRSRILYGVRLFLFSAFLIAPASAQEPVTIEGRINRNAYPISRFREKAEPIPKTLESELRARINQVLTPIRLAPAAWFRASLGAVPAAGDRRRILESTAETEIWACTGPTCLPCPGNEGSGCVLGNAVPAGVGVVALIHPCLVGGGKCAKGVSGDLAAWAEKVVLGIAYYKSGQPRNAVAFRKALAASGEWLANTSRSVNLLLGACPGPYSADSLKFLLGVEAIAVPNAAVLRCGRTYLEELRSLPTRCKSLAGEDRAAWSEFTSKAFRSTAEILRCDPYCMKMLCRARDAIAVFTRFSDKPALLLGDGACEGETPKLRGRFFRESLPAALRSKLGASGCLPPAEYAPETRNADGPGVQLIDQ